MRKKISLRNMSLYVVALITLFCACTKDEEAPGKQTEGKEKGKLTFNIVHPRSFTLRSVAEGDENGGVDDKIAFYQFDRKGIYEQRYIINYGDAVSVDEADGIRSYELELTSSSTGEKRFVVIEGKDESVLPELDATATMETLLNQETANEDGILQPPFMMSNALMNGCNYLIVFNVESDNNQVSVTLKRRVARFDLLNDPAVSGVIIDKVYIKNRRTRGFIGDVNGYVSDVAADVLEIPASELANGGKSFYLYPTKLTSTLEQDEATVIWATTRSVTTNEEGPTLYLDLSSDIDVEANYLYQLNTKNIAGSAGFDITIQEWQEGSSIDWVTTEDGISVMDGNAQIIEGTDVKGKYVKITKNATFPYVIKQVITDFNEANLEADYDGDLPSWLTVSSSTIAAGSGFYRHEIVYTVAERPDNDYQYAVTYLKGQVSDENLLVIGFTNPYPGTPLPCLSWGDNLYSPIHAKQSTYLIHNNVDKAYFCGAEGFTFDTDMASKVNDVAVNPCPEGWRTLNDDEAEDYILWVGKHLKSQVSNSVYTYNWFEKSGEGTDLRILAGYSKSGSPTEKDLATWGTWPNVAWVNIKLPDLTIQDQTFGNEWSVDGKYGIPYRCIRAKEGWE